MNSQPLISVVVPTYNRIATIGACLRSIQTQTRKNWEAVVVDDGSSDGTAELVAQFQREDARIRLIRQDCNRGAQAARNTGICAAEGEWVAFLDSDDQYLPESLESRLELTRKEKVLVVHSEGYVLEVDGTRRRYGVPPMVGQVYRRLLRQEGPMFQGLLVSKEALKRINYLDEKIVAFQEWDTAIRLAKFYPFTFEAKPTFIWDCRQPDTISKDMRRNGKGYEQVLHKHYLPILRFTGPGALARHYRLAAAWYQKAGDARAVRRCLLMARLWSCLEPKSVVQTLRRALSHRR